MIILNELQVLNLYNEAPEGVSEEFFSNINSSLNVKLDYDKTETNDEWITIMEDTIRYIDNILRNPNRLSLMKKTLLKLNLRDVLLLKVLNICPEILI